MFEKFNFSHQQIIKYFQAAIKDLSLAKSAKEPEIIFYVSYNIIIKTAMAVCAKNQLRVKSRMGHHQELIAKLAEYLQDSEIEILAGKMRIKRNRDLYEGGTITSQKEADFYLSFCKKLITKADAYLFPDKLFKI
jgi:hypothetical protein